MYRLAIGFYFWNTIVTLLYFVIGIMVCLVSLLSSFEQLYEVRFILQDRAIILFNVTPPLIRVIN